MSRFMKKAIKIVLLPSLISSFAFAIEIKNLSVAVDVAGKQRMFTQRMLKDYAMVGLENNFGNPGEDLKKIVGSFENHLNSLIEFNKDEATKVSLEKVKVMWGPIKAALNEPPSKDKAGKITREKIKEIAEMKMSDLNAADVENAMKIIEGTARSMGVVVE